MRDTKFNQFGRQMFRKYTRTQIIIHWIVVVMIVVQWWTSAAIPRTHSTLLPATEWDLLQHKIHNYSGIIIGVLIVLRVALRFVHRSHERPSAGNWTDRAATVVHSGLYLALTAQAVTGFVASYYWGQAFGAHKVIWYVILALSSVHVIAAAWHGIRKDGVLVRMLPWKPV